MKRSADIIDLMTSPADRPSASTLPPRTAFIQRQLGTRCIVLVGLMGSGKSAIGRRLGSALSLPFFDADIEIESAAGKSIEDIFREHGEPYFRDGEERVMKRLLETGPHVLATGGGAILRPKTRALIAERSVSIWLKASIDLILTRVSKRDNRPLLKTGNPRAVLEDLLKQREPLYQAADITFESRDASHDLIVDEIVTLLHAHLAQKGSR